MIEWITKGIPREGVVEISKHLIEEYKRICKAMEVRVRRGRGEEAEWVCLVWAIKKWMTREGFAEWWSLEGVSGGTLPVALSISLVGSWRWPYSMLIIGLEDD
jgi:hypothetical protein